MGDLYNLHQYMYSLGRESKTRLYTFGHKERTFDVDEVNINIIIGTNYPI